MNESDGSQDQHDSTKAVAVDKRATGPTYYYSVPILLRLPSLQSTEYSTGLAV